VRFFFADSQDLVDPAYDFTRETHDVFRLRQRDDRYPHEVLAEAPYDGLLISKSIVDGVGGASGRYTLGQKLRLRRLGARRFFRLRDDEPERIETMGDCGAFSYARQEVPPYSVDDVLGFYEDCGFDYGVSIDHVILGFDRDGRADPEMLREWQSRQQLTIELAAEFLDRHRTQRARVKPLGAAQGWSPESYAESVRQLREIGYERIAIGGMVPLKTPAIISVLRAVDEVRSGAQLHLLGVTRVEHVATFASFGVTSFDSTSPLRQAFMDDDDNYYWWGKNFVAVRVPPSEANSRLRLKVRAGQLDHDRVLDFERTALRSIRRFAADEIGLQEVLDAVHRYSELIGERKDRTSAYAETLSERPWTKCDCTVCMRVGVEVIIFRGAERNRRRGFHNLHVFSKRLALHGVGGAALLLEGKVS